MDNIHCPMFNARAILGIQGHRRRVYLHYECWVYNPKEYQELILVLGIIFNGEFTNTRDEELNNVACCIRNGGWSAS